MFFSYLWNELRRRKKQTVVIALGLALGIGLVVTVSAMATGVQQAQSTVLHSLYGVGTDITVTRSDTAGGPPTGGFRFGGDGSDTFKRDRILQTPGLASFDGSQATQIAGISGVADAAGGLNLSAIHVSGKLPTGFGGTPGQGGQGFQSPGQGFGRLNFSSFTIAGVDTAHLGVGPISSTTVTGGRGFSPSDAQQPVAIADRSYAKQQGLAVGSTVSIEGTKFTLIGLSAASSNGSGSDIYVPLVQAQSLAGSKGQVNNVYVKAASSSIVPTVKQEIKTASPKSTVTTASDLAKQVSGSLSSASNLSTKLGAWLSLTVLVAALAIASLLTMSAVGRRTRELGTLKALGWRTPRVVGQVMGEALAQCSLGGVLGIAVGVAGAWLVTRAAPALTATLSASPGEFAGRSGFRPGSGGGPGGANPFVRSVSVALRAPIDMRLVALAIGLSLLGGLIAGSFGGWRAARLRPADAMRQVV